MSTVLDFKACIPIQQIAVKSQKNNIWATSRDVALMFFWWLSIVICWLGYAQKHYHNSDFCHYFKPRLPCKACIDRTKLSNINSKKYIIFFSKFFQPFCLWTTTPQQQIIIESQKNNIGEMLWDFVDFRYVATMLF